MMLLCVSFYMIYPIQCRVYHENKFKDVTYIYIIKYIRNILYHA